MSGLPPLSIQTALSFSDSRMHGHVGPNRTVHLPRASSSGGGAMCNNEDDTRCAVAGKESLRVIRVLDPGVARNPEYKSALGAGGYRAEMSRNFWDGSGLKIDSASTDVAWGSSRQSHCTIIQSKEFCNKILTSARNGEVIMWDITKAKYERRVKDHTRSIHKLALSSIVQHYCITGSSDGDLRIWDIRDMSHSINRIHFPTTIRSLAFSPTSSHPLQVMVGLDNGNIYRWELKMAQRGQLDRVPVAHTAPVTALDWRLPDGAQALGGVEPQATGLGWIVSGGLDRTVKIWDLSWPSVSSHIQHKPTYTLHPSFPVRNVHWRPGYACELAVVSNSEFTTGSNPDLGAIGGVHRSGSSLTMASDVALGKKPIAGGDAVELWDARRGWVAKWCVSGSASEGGVTGMTFHDSHAIWTQHVSGMFAQIDLRDSFRPLDRVPRVATTWDAAGNLAFVTDEHQQWEVPYDDTPLNRERVGERAGKALGDPIYRPDTQMTGTMTSADAFYANEAFVSLAKTYVFHGQNRQDMCALNAQLAFRAGSPHAGRMWLLAGASLTDIVPTDGEMPSMPSDSTVTQVVSPNGLVADASLPTSSSASSMSRNKSSPGGSSSFDRDGAMRSGSASRRITPESSKHSSPRQGPLSLLPGAPAPLVLGRKSSGDGVSSSSSSPLVAARRPSVYGRVSSNSPSTIGSLRHIGEGTLDDSDSSGSDDEKAPSSDEESLFRPLLSPTLLASRMSSQPSPLSRFVSPNGNGENGDRALTEDGDEDENEGEGEDEDEDEDSSPSPQSTDSETEDEANPNLQSPSLRARQASSRGSRRSSFQTSVVKSRSRASTGGSVTLHPRSVTRKASHSSTKTVMGDQHSPGGLRQEETVRDLSHTREMSELALDDDPVKEEKHPTSDRRPDLVQADESSFREMAWAALREGLDEFANEGNVQMCAMLTLVIGHELNMKKERMLAFVEAYIDVLTRLRLYRVTAAIRKYCTLDEIRDPSLLETTIYTSCGRCRKALMVPLGVSLQRPNGGYWLCQNCKNKPISCSICRLPVRGLLVQCSVCSHGGHQHCYHKFYLNRPMDELPSQFEPHEDDRGRPVTRGSLSALLHQDDLTDEGVGGSARDLHGDGMLRPLPTTNTDNLMGHPCAAGCGHFCWAATGARDE
ncbi:hypothetical protein CYLTODRAFT_359035 [Cylindrobasidium torrendii FP15055 ss-10]|uniref:Uncharacterized protein n=1 Tax=Cylindrobasidium torrendii FP15055 ss-10 TaxID=1314674 RepID=A0A0D7B0M9_9AGAR|nr:hypothetical protein CYLTODRAFT_359035 [Cylindrobasidium torrendii FP15055 ss-10]